MLLFVLAFAFVSASGSGSGSGSGSQQMSGLNSPQTSPSNNDTNNSENNNINNSENNNTNNSENNNTNNSENNNTNNPQENLSTEQQLDKAKKDLSEAEIDLADLKKEKDHVEMIYNKHSDRRCVAQDYSEDEIADFELGFLEDIRPYLDDLEEQWDKAQEHIQELIDIISSLS